MRIVIVDKVETTHQWLNDSAQVVHHILHLPQAMLLDSETPIFKTWTEALLDAEGKQVVDKDGNVVVDTKSLQVPTAEVEKWFNRLLASGHAATEDNALDKIREVQAKADDAHAEVLAAQDATAQ